MQPRFTAILSAMTRDPQAMASDPSLRNSIIRSAAGIGLYGGALGVSFGAVSGGAGLSIWQTMLLSVVMFSGGSQFAFVGAVASPWAALSVAMLLAVRNMFYGVRMVQYLAPLGWWRPLTAQLVIDESTAMAIAQPSRNASCLAFYATGIAIFVFWNTGTLVGILLERGIDTYAFGLDVAAPVAFMALLWPTLTTRLARTVAIVSAAVAFLLIPVAPAGVPVLVTAVVAVAAGLTRDTAAPDATPEEQDR